MKEVQNYRWKKYTILVLLSLIVIVFFILIGCKVSETASYPPGNEQISIRGLKPVTGYDLPALGANFVELEWHFSIDPESWEITADKSEREMKKKIAGAHEQGLGVYLLPFLHFKDKPGAVGATTAPDIDFFLAQLDSLAVEWATFAEENEVELFTPVNELQHWVGREEGKIGFMRASEWYQGILPKIKQVYSGELITGYNSFFYDLIQQNVSDYEINQTGYDYISLSVVPHRIKNYDDYAILIDHLIETAEYWREKFAAKGIIVTEVGVPESSDSLSFYLHGEQQGKSYGAMRAHLYDVFFSRTLGKIDGYFISDWSSGEVGFYLNDRGNYVTALQGEEVVNVIRKYYLWQAEREAVQKITKEIKKQPQYLKSCIGTGTAMFTSPPMALEDIAFIEPMGQMSGGHVTPIDHGYYTAKSWKPGAPRDNPAVFKEIMAPADGIIQSIQSMPAEFSSSDIGDYRIEIAHTCTFSTIYIHINQLAPKLQAIADTDKKLEVKTGEVIGKAPGFDFSVHDEETTLGFIVPKHYEVEPWKIHTVDMFAPFVEPLRSKLLKKNIRQKEPRGGKIDYDIDGKLVGNWFEENTNGYYGKEEYQRMTGYWITHLAFAYNGLDPSLITVSLGDFNGEAQQFAVKGNAPDPATVDENDGLVKYGLVLFEYLTNERSFWDRTSFAKVVEAKGMDEVRGTVLVQMLEKRKIKVEVFPEKSASQVEGFTGNAKMYER